VSTQTAAAITGTVAPGGQDMAVGQWAELRRTFRLADVQAFGDLVGDHNPIHQQWSAGNWPPLLRAHPLAREDPEGTSRALVHGMLVASLFTSLFGTLIPGAIYCQQTLHFRKPVYVDEVVVGRIQVQSMRRWRRGVMLTCSTRVHNEDNGTDCVLGEAEVLLPDHPLEAYESHDKA
jgi:acyl dehydratase